MTIISGIISMYGDSCRTPVKIMIAIMPSMQPPITHGSAFWMPDGGNLDAEVVGRCHVDLAGR